MKTRIARILLFLAGLPLLVTVGLIHAARPPRAVGDSAQETAEPAPHDTAQPTPHDTAQPAPQETAEPALQQTGSSNEPSSLWTRPLHPIAKWASLSFFVAVCSVWVFALWCLQLPFTAVSLGVTFAGLGLSLATREHNSWVLYAFSLAFGVVGIAATVVSVTSGGEPGPIFPCWWPL